MSASSACNIEEGAITSFLHTFSELLPDVESFDDVALSAALDGRNPALLITLYSALLCPLLQRQKPLATWSDIESKLFPAIRARRNRMLGDIPPLQAMQNWPRELQARVISNLCDWVAEEHADFRNSTSRSEPIGTDAQQRNYYYFADGSAHFRIYRLDVNDSSWSLCCRTSEEMEELARSLRHRSMNAAALADYVEHTLLPDLNRKHEAKLRAASRISRLGLSVQNIMSERPRRAASATVRYNFDDESPIEFEDSDEPEEISDDEQADSEEEEEEEDEEQDITAGYQFNSAAGQDGNRSTNDAIDLVKAEGGRGDDDDEVAQDEEVEPTFDPEEVDEIEDKDDDDDSSYSGSE